MESWTRGDLRNSVEVLALSGTKRELIDNWGG
jgi:hypothetical protein